MSSHDSPSARPPRTAAAGPRTALERYALLESDALWFDGRSARARHVAVKFGQDSLTIMTFEGEPLTHWSLGGVRAIDAAGDGGPAGAAELRLSPGGDADERLVVADAEMIAAIRAVCPDLHRRPRPPKGATRSLLLWAAGAVGAVLAIVFVLVPAIAVRLAEAIPPEREVALGERAARQVAWALSAGSPRFCTAPEGQAAMQRMTDRLVAGLEASGRELPLPLTVRVLAHPMANAVAMPGGQIMVFSGLISLADGPEQVAGVLAHEIGHVVARDPTREALRSAGTAGTLGLLIGDVTGGSAIAAVADALVNAGYSRQAEADADAAAHAIFAEAALPASALGEMFEKFETTYGEGPGGVMSHLASHPDLGERAEQARQADVIGEAPWRPVLDDAGWIALQQICDE